MGIMSEKGIIVIWGIKHTFQSFDSYIDWLLELLKLLCNIYFVNVILSRSKLDYDWCMSVMSCYI